MPRPIDANALIQDFDRRGWDGVQTVVDMMPTIDAVPVVHGRWVPKADGFWKKQILICSNCETRNALNYEFNYCPNCGARMDGERYAGH